MKYRPAVALALALCPAVPAAARAHRTAAATIAQAIGDRIAAPAADCIDPHDVRSTLIVEGTAIVYDAGDRLYVQRPQAGAASLRRDDVLVSRIDGGQLCRLDTVTLVEPVTRMQRGFVVLGPFAVYRARR